MRSAYTGEPRPCPSLDPASRASIERTATASPQDFGARLQEQMRQEWREFRVPMPGSEPLPHRTPDIVPDGARFITGSFTNQAGTRSYKLFIPSGYHGQPLPLVVMLHGCTQDPDDFAAGTQMNALAEEQLCFVAYPAQTHAANGSKCWNWFKASDQQRDGGEPSIIAGLTRQIADSHSVRPAAHLRGRAVGRWRDGGNHGDHLPRPLCGGRHPLRAFPWRCPGHARRIRRNARRPACFGEPAHDERGARPDHRVSWRPGYYGASVQWRAGGRAFRTCAYGAGYIPAGATTPRGTVQSGQVPDGHAYTLTTYHDASGHPIVEHWLIHGAGHFSVGRQCPRLLYRS